jgi:hypothetical protein
MDLASHLDVGRAVEIGGRSLRFSEFTLEALARLQGWIKDNHPSPLKAIQGQLEGFAPDEREAILQGARRDMQSWPPSPGSADFSRLLFDRREGHLAFLAEALKVHQPDEPTLAEWVYQRIKNDAGKSKEVARIVFGADPDAEDGPGKGETGAEGKGSTST